MLLTSMLNELRPTFRGLARHACKSCAVRKKANDRSALFIAHSLSAVTFTILQLSMLC